MKVVVQAYNGCMKAIAKFGTGDTARYFVYTVLSKCVSRVRAYSCRLEVSRKKRISGNACFVYRGADDVDVVQEESESNARLLVNYSVSYVLKSLKTTLEPALMVCGLGGVEDLLSMFVTF
jgi:hypothetical protein